MRSQFSSLNCEEHHSRLGAQVDKILRCTSSPSLCCHSSLKDDRITRISKMIKSIISLELFLTTSVLYVRTHVHYYRYLQFEILLRNLYNNFTEIYYYRNMFMKEFFDQFMQPANIQVTVIVRHSMYNYEKENPPRGNNIGMCNHYYILRVISVEIYIASIWLTLLLI